MHYSLFLTNSTSNVEASPFGGTPVSIQLPTVVISHQILSFASPACACGHERETAHHITVFCPEYRATRNQRLIDGGLDFKRLLTEKERVSKLARWWIRSGRLNQFRHANELIK